MIEHEFLFQKEEKKQPHDEDIQSIMKYFSDKKRSVEESLVVLSRLIYFIFMATGSSRKSFKMFTKSLLEEWDKKMQANEKEKK